MELARAFLSLTGRLGYSGSSNKTLLTLLWSDNYSVCFRNRVEAMSPVGKPFNHKEYNNTCQTKASEFDLSHFGSVSAPAFDLSQGEPKQGGLLGMLPDSPLKCCEPKIVGQGAKDDSKADKSLSTPQTKSFRLLRKTINKRSDTKRKTEYAKRSRHLETKQQSTP
jgi:hypothetical protein